MVPTTAVMAIQQGRQALNGDRRHREHTGGLYCHVEHTKVQPYAVY